MAEAKSKKRCAIYTRKSTEDGLEQDFNSLDAQREACAAYILSQASEGWEAVPEFYDDGGWSGGTMNRPAITQLLGDVKAGKVDVIVVYKVDRLTRSLADFAKIVEILDENEASFVSVTQSFNTTTSMGRLTLNVLLSFAQFEREVTGERIRDKIAASKKKGMWMGGPIPIGYDLKDRKLVINDSEAEAVRHMFRLYTKLKSVPQLVDELAADGYRTKQRLYKGERIVGGIPFRAGSLTKLLHNPIYTGKVKHKDAIYDGEHEARLYRYYTTRLEPGEKKNSVWRMPCGEIERIVMNAIADELASLPSVVGKDADTLAGLIGQNDRLMADLPSMSISDKRELLLDLDVKVQVTADTVVIDLLLKGHEDRHKFTVNAKLVSRGIERKLAIAPDQGSATCEADPILLRLISHAFAARDHLIDNIPQSMVAHYSKRYMYQLVRLSYLAPDIIAAIINGTQPPELTGRQIMRKNNIPLDWDSQRIMFGFA